MRQKIADRKEAEQNHEDRAPNGSLARGAVGEREAGSESERSPNEARATDAEAKSQAHARKLGELVGSGQSETVDTF